MRIKFLLLSIVMVVFFGVAVPVHASSSDNVSGWAWSDTIGWISFNSTTDGSSVGYGVNINSSTGNMSGYAWSDNIGWISFNTADTTGCPTAPCQAKLVGTTFEGWAKALAADNNGWDGWISMKGSGYGVTLSGNSIQGYAWGDTNVGWLKFDLTFGGVFYNATGGVQVKRIDSSFNDLSDPATTAYVDGGSPKTPNPAYYTGIVSGSHTAGVDQNGRTLKAGICSYNNGGTECSLNNISSFTLTPTCNGTVCSVPITVSDGFVTKAVFMYSTPGNVMVKRVGPDGTTTSLPDVTTATLDMTNVNSSNPAVYTGLNGSHTAGTSVITGYTVDVATCSYVIAGSECTVGAYGPATTVNGAPTYTVTVTGGQVQKVQFRYTKAASDKGDFLVKRVDSTGSTLISGTTATLDGANSLSTNPAIYQNLSGSHTAGASALSGYTVSVGSCTYDIPAGGTANSPEGCSVNTFSPATLLSGAPVYTIDAALGQVRKIVFKYSLIDTSGTTGDFLIKRVNASGNPISGTTATLDSATPISTNPAVYTNLTGSHNAGASALTDYVVTVGSCTYSRPSGGTQGNSDDPPTGCTVGSYGPATIVNGAPTLLTSVSAGQVRKVVFKYTPDSVTPPGTFTCNPIDPATGRQLKTAPIGRPVQWKSIGGQPGDTYVWSGSVEASGTDITSVTKVYTTLGVKQVFLSVNGSTPVSCNVTVPQFKVTVDPNYQEF